MCGVKKTQQCGVGEAAMEASEDKIWCVKRHNNKNKATEEAMAGVTAAEAAAVVKYGGGKAAA